MRLISVVASLGSILLLAGCGANIVSNPTSASIPAPIVLGTGMQTNGVAINRAIDVQFSAAINPATLTPQTFLLVKSSGGTTVPGTVTYDPTNFVAIFKPSAPLAVDTTYNATITTGVTSASGVPLAASYTFSFVTRNSADASAIKVYETIPAANQTAVSVDSTIKIVFTEGADPTTVNTKDILVNDIDGNSIPGTVAYDIVTNYATFTPLSALSPGTTYTVIVSGVTDLASQPMAQPYSFSFTTAGTTTQVQDLLYEADVAPGSISGWVVDLATGTITPTPGGPYQSGLEPVQMIPSPNGSTLYVIMGNQPPGFRGSNCNNFNTQVFSYAVDHSTGALTEENRLALNGFCAASSSAIDPTGHFLYVGQTNGPASAGIIDTISLTSGGQMALVAGSPFASPESITSLVLDGNYLYSGDSNSFDTNGLLTFQRNPSTGAVQFVSATALPPQYSLAVSPSGNTLYTVGSTGQYIVGSTVLISEFQVNALTGALTPEGTVNTGSPSYYQLAVDPQARYVSISSVPFQQTTTGTTFYNVATSGTLLTTGQNVIPITTSPGLTAFDTTGSAATVLGGSELFVYGLDGASNIKQLTTTPAVTNPGTLTLFTK